MSVNVSKDQGPTAVTAVADRTSKLPPLCQILKNFCYSLKCCDVHKGLMKTDVTAALGTIQIMVGLFNIGLGPGRIKTNPESFTSLGAAYWLGAVFIVAGILTLLAGRLPSLFMVGFAVLINIVGCVFSIAGIALYAKDVADAPATNMCDWGFFHVRVYGINCDYMANFAQDLLTTMDITLIVMAVLQLCVCISFAVLAIKAWVNRKKEEGGPHQQLELEEVLLSGPDA